MKDGSRYAELVRKRFPKSSLPAAEVGDAPIDPLVQLGCAILGGGVGEESGRQALERMRRTMIDWNEIRVSAPLDLAAAVGRTIDQADARCDALRRALNAVFDRESRMSLESLRSMKIRDARQYLMSLDGGDEFAAASVVLWSLGGHAIPVDDRAMEALRHEKLVHPEASRAEVQAFLERAVPAAQARPFSLMLRALGAAHARDGAVPAATHKRNLGGTSSRKKASSKRTAPRTTARKPVAAKRAAEKSDMTERKSGSRST